LEDEQLMLDYAAGVLRAFELSSRAVGATPARVLSPFVRQQGRRRRSAATDLHARAPRAPALPGAVAAARLAVRHRRPAPAGRVPAAAAARERRRKSCAFRAYRRLRALLTPLLARDDAAAWLAPRLAQRAGAPIQT